MLTPIHTPQVNTCITTVSALDGPGSLGTLIVVEVRLGQLCIANLTVDLMLLAFLLFPIFDQSFDISSKNVLSNDLCHPLFALWTAILNFLDPFDDTLSTVSM